jgi:TonB-dependent SusC/RagA subfamily outer membrane receptor
LDNNDKHIIKILREKIERHEFDFDARAWDKMEALLDSPPPKQPSHFFTTKKIILMIGIFALLLALLDPWRNEPPQQAQAQPPIEKKTMPNVQKNIDNGIIAKNDASQNISKASNSQFVNTQKEKPAAASNQNVPPVHLRFSKQPKPTLATTALPELLPVVHAPIIAQSSDSLFFQKLKSQLADFSQTRAAEKVYLHFDRTFFKPGEDVWFNAFVRDANSLKASPTSSILYVELLNPKGSIEKKLTLVTDKGVAKGDFHLSDAMPGGIYKVRAYTNWQRNFDEAFERDIQLQKSVLPRLLMELDFEREAYGVSDEVVAKLELKSLDNKPLSGHAFQWALALDGEPLPSKTGQTDANGKGKIAFHLPKELHTNDGLLSVSIALNGQTEAISRAVPIVLNKIDLQFFPESGELVAGLSNSLAFKAINEFGEPADVAGFILDQSGKSVATFKSYHQGMGAVENFKPVAGEHYKAKITQPQGIEDAFPLPGILERGYALHLAQQRGNSLLATVKTTENERLHLVVQSRDAIYFATSMDAKAGDNPVEIPTDDLPIGIAQITLFDSKEVPRAERLAFFNIDKKLNIKINTDKEQYLPREKVRLSVEVQDERGLPMPAQLSLAVVDDKLRSFADDKQGRLLAYLLLESDLQGKVAEPNFYFEPKDKHPNKDQAHALDLLMLTQGWRRFNWFEQIGASYTQQQQHPAEKAIVAGQVRLPSGRPAPYTLVEIPDLQLSTYTDEKGRFEFEGVTFYEGERLLIKAQQGDFKAMTRVNKYANDLHIRFSDNVAITGTIQGVVTDEAGEPLIGANVVIKGTNFGTITDFDGMYSIYVPDIEFPILQFSYTGYATKEMPVNNHVMDVSLSEGVSLAEVVTIGYGTRRKLFNKKEKKSERQRKERNQSNAPQIVDANTAAPSVATTDVANLLQGRAAGIQITPSKEDKNGDLKIRGAASLSAGQQPLIVKDGVVIDRKEFANIDPKDIKNVQVLKDAAATKLYGSRAASGVILINTQEGAGALSATDKAILEAALRQNALDYATAFKEGYYRAREFYAPVYTSKEATEETRTDFRSTAYWQPSVAVGRNGKAELEFFTPDALTAFRVTAEGIGMDGGPGEGEHRFFTQQAFGMDVKMPANVLTGDVLRLPVLLHNRGDKDITGRLSIDAPAHFVYKNNFTKQIAIKKGESISVFPEFEIGFQAKSGDVRVAFEGKDAADAFVQPVSVLPRGFPVTNIFSGNAVDKTFNLNINDLVEGSLSAELVLHPDVLSEITGGMERMLRQPTGCFEQTSSSNYPNLLVLDCLRSSKAADKAVEKRAMQLLDAGYKRLLTFEVKGGGFDWYGNPPAHEALTAYGLMEFVDMQAVYPVDDQLIERTANWLLSRRDGKGGWKSSGKGLHTWDGQSPVSNAYITWALVEAGFGKRIPDEIAHTYESALSSGDPYIMALAANILSKMADTRSKNIVKNLMQMQAEDGSWTGKTTSMTQSRGHGFTVETTALAALALMNDNAKGNALHNALQFLASAKTEYGFGSTQATVLALKALNEYAKLFPRTVAAGTLDLYINGQRVERADYAANGKEDLVFNNLGKYLKAGDNKIRVSFSKQDAVMNYDLRVIYSTRQPQNAEGNPLQLTTTLATKQPVKMGQSLRLNCVLKNLSDEALPNPIAIIGIPAGLSLQPWQLKEMQEKRIFDYYEIKDNYLVCYFRYIDKQASVPINLDLKADITGQFEAPASVAYLYYYNEMRHWCRPEGVRIVQ